MLSKMDDTVFTCTGTSFGAVQMKMSLESSVFIYVSDHLEQFGGLEVFLITGCFHHCENLNTIRIDV